MSTVATLPVLPLFQGDYTRGEEPNEWLCRLNLNLLISWSDAQRSTGFADSAPQEV